MRFSGVPRPASVTTLPLPTAENRGHTGADRLAVEVDRAGAALRQPAAEWGLLRPMSLRSA